MTGALHQNRRCTGGGAVVDRQQQNDSTTNKCMTNLGDALKSIREALNKIPGITEREVEEPMRGPLSIGDRLTHLERNVTTLAIQIN